MAANITPYQESSYFYLGDRTFLASLQYLIRREMSENVHNGESMVSTKYLSMMYVADKIKQYLSQIVSVVGAQDRRLDHLSSMVDKFIDEVVIPRQFYWGHHLNREVNDLICARKNERRVCQIIRGDESSADEEEEVCEVVKRPRRPIVEIEELGDVAAAAADDDDDSDCSVLNDPFIRKSEKGTQISEECIEITDDAEDGSGSATTTTTTTSTTLTIGKSAVKQAIADMLKRDTPPAPKKGRKTQSPPPSPECTPLKGRPYPPTNSSSKKKN